MSSLYSLLNVFFCRFLACFATVFFKFLADLFQHTPRSRFVCLMVYSFVCFQKCSNPAVSGDCILAVNRTGVHFLSHTTVVSEERQQ